MLWQYVVDNFFVVIGAESYKMRILGAISFMDFGIAD